MFWKVFAKVFLIILVINIGKCTNVSPTRNPQSSDIKVTVCPVGLRVELRNNPRNVERFSVHLNINIRLASSAPGHYNGDLVKPVNNSWVFEECGVTLRASDRLYFWVSTQRNGLLYFYEDLTYVVKRGQIKNECSCNQRVPLETPVPLFPTEPCASEKIDSLVEQVVTLQDKATIMETEIRQLHEVADYMLQKDSSATKIIITGQTPPETRVRSLVKEFLSDKLDLFSLIPQIKSVDTTEDGIIVELKTALDAAKIVARGQIKLADSRFSVKLFQPHEIDPVFVRSGW